MLATLLALALQDAIELKTNDGVATPQVRLSITSGATTAELWVRRGRLKFDATNGYLNVASPPAGTPVAGDLRFDGSNLLFYTTSWQTVLTSQFWTDSGSGYLYPNTPSANTGARVYGGGQRYSLAGLHPGAVDGTAWVLDASYAGIFGANTDTGAFNDYHAGVIGSCEANTANGPNGGVVGYRVQTGTIIAIGGLGYKIDANNIAGAFGSSSTAATNNYGLYGYANGTATNYGVFGWATGGTTNWAGYFEGNVRVADTISRVSDVSGNSRLNLYHNTGAVDSRSWIELWGNDPARAGELALSGAYIQFRIDGNLVDVGNVKMTLDANGALLVGNPSLTGDFDIHLEDFTAGTGTWSVTNVCGTFPTWTNIGGYVRASDTTPTGVSELRSPGIVIPAGYAAIRLRLRHLLATESTYDGGNVWVRINGGAWQAVTAAMWTAGGYANNVSVTGG